MSECAERMKETEHETLSGLPDAKFESRFDEKKFDIQNILPAVKKRDAKNN